MTHIDTMKLALEALESVLCDLDGNVCWSGSYADRDIIGDALEAIRQAIAEAEKQEPHSWYSSQEDEWMTEKTRKEHERLNSYTHKVCGFDLPLYHHPQPKQEQGEPIGTAGELFTNAALERLDFRPSTKIYTTPQQRTWVGLTDEECRLTYTSAMEAPVRDQVTVCRAIEAKLRSKNERL